MNKSSKMENIMAYIEEQDIDYLDSSYVLFGRMDAKGISSALFGITGLILSKQFIIVFGKEHLTLILLTQTGDFKEIYREIPYDDIFHSSVKKGMLFATLKFHTGDEVFKIKCNKKYLVCHGKKRI